MHEIPVTQVYRSRISCPGLAPAGRDAVRVVYSVASMSWINPRLCQEIRLPEVDQGGDPGMAVPRSAVVGKKVYRFANLLEVEVTIERGRIVAGQFTPASGMYRSPSFLHIPSVAYSGRRSLTRVGTGLRAVQLTGCATQSPQVIGSAVATGKVKVLAAALAAGATCGSIAIRPNLQDEESLWAHRGNDFLRWAGCRVAASVSGFPPIWSELELTISSNGCATSRILRHSLFPSVTFYQQDTGQPVAYSRQWQHDGSPECYYHWFQHDWGVVRPVSGNAVETVATRISHSGSLADQGLPRMWSAPAASHRAFDGNPWGLKREDICHRPVGPVWEASGNQRI